MTICRSLVATLLTLSIVMGAQGHNFGKRDLEDLGYAYGYVMGQEKVAHYIATTYPSLARDVTAAQQAFNARYPTAKTAIDRHLKHFSVNETKFYQTLDNELAKYRPEDYIRTLADAQALVQEMRIRLDQPDPSAAKTYRVLSDLIYSDRPEEEYLQSYQRYSSQGHPKARGVNLNLQIPLSWQGEEGRRPHVVQKWTKVDEGETIVLLLLVAEKNVDPQAFQDDLRKGLSEDDWQDILGWVFPKKSRRALGPHSVVTVDGQKAMLMEGVLDVEQMGQKAMGHHTVLLTNAGDKLLTVTVAVYGDTPQKMEALRSKYATVTRLILSSIVFPDRWQ